MDTIVSRWTNIVNGATAVNGAPSTSTDGIAIPLNCKGGVTLFRVRQTATGGDVRGAELKLWGYCAGEYDTSGTAISSSAGWDDLGVKLALCTSANGNSLAFTTKYAVAYSRIYVQILNITGTGTTISVAAAFTDEE